MSSQLVTRHGTIRFAPRGHAADTNARRARPIARFCSALLDSLLLCSQNSAPLITETASKVFAHTHRFARASSDIMPARKRVVLSDDTGTAPTGGAVPPPSSSAFPAITPSQMTAPVNPMPPQLIAATLATSPSPADHAAEAFAQLSFGTTPMLPDSPSTSS